MDRYAHGAYYAIAVGKPSEDTWAGGDGGMAYVLGTGGSEGGLPRKISSVRLRPSVRCG